MATKRRSNESMRYAECCTWGVNSPGKHAPMQHMLSILTHRDRRNDWDRTGDATGAAIEGVNALSVWKPTAAKRWFGELTSICWAAGRRWYPVKSGWKIEGQGTLACIYLMHFPEFRGFRRDPGGNPSAFDGTSSYGLSACGVRRIQYVICAGACDSCCGDENHEVRDSAHCPLTPELSRPVAGRRVRASVARARSRRHDTGSA
jgi:hypothetical protein